MKLAVVILNWNGRKLLEEFLPSVVAHTNNAELYVIDNASTDDSISFLNTHYPQIKIIQNQGNYGFAKGYNEGLKHIDADIYCLLNSDVEVTANWTEPIMELFKKDASIAAIQPKILDYKNKSKFEYAGAGGGFIDEFGYPFCRGRVFFDLEEDKGQYNDTIECFWATGASLFIRQEDFVRQKGFDEDFFAHMEEIDLCWRLKNDNRKIYYCGQSTVYHLGGGTLQKNNPKKTYLNFRNCLNMYLKNLPKDQLFTIIFSRLSLDGISAIVFLFQNGFGHLWAIFMSHMHFYRDFSKMYKKRGPHQIRNYGSKKLIPVQYFIQKRKKYQDLE